MRSKPITIHGVTMSIFKWSKVEGAQKYATIIRRLLRNVPEEQAVFGSDQRGKTERIRKSRKKAVLKPVAPRQATAYRPMWGYCQSWPIEALDVLRRV